MDINSPVSLIPKIGPKYKALLSKLNINTLGDMLYHFPFRYDDYSQIKKIDQLIEGETATIQATLVKVDNIFTRYGKKFTKARVMDSTGVLDILWFNQHYLKTVLIPDVEYSWSGKVTKFNNKIGLISPDFEVTKKNSLNTGRLVSVYPETAGVSSKFLRSRINDVIGEMDNKIGLDEFIPSETLIKNKLEPLDKAIRAIHFPKNTTEAFNARKRFAFEEMFLELLKVEGKKDIWLNKYKGIKVKYNEQAINKFINKLPFKLTESQTQAVFEILKDMAGDQPMNRLLEGDVGTGKTVVAAIASYAAISNKFKVLYMAPTDVLAQQHYTTFTKFLGEKNVGLLTASVKHSIETIEKNILIGTHALLFAKMPENIALVVIDEQHRFGVKQRAALQNIHKDNTKPHLLSMTATPIPRTLALTLYGDLSISGLKTAPNKDKKITTRVVTDKAREKAFEWIKKRVLTNGDHVFVVCPFIEISDVTDLTNIRAATAEFEKLKRNIFNDVAIGLLHGKMKSIEKQTVLDKFRSGEIKVLVSTPVIEVGVDIPQATIMVIESAERYGLASLHQLRGRVGRGTKEGFCFVFMSNNSRAAYTRLKYLETVTSGLALADIDLKNRGQGDLYGTMQSGFKTFKVADLSDTGFIELAKKEAQSIFPRLDEFPRLKEKIKSTGGFYGTNN